MMIIDCKYRIKSNFWGEGDFYWGRGIFLGPRTHNICAHALRSHQNCNNGLIAIVSGIPVQASKNSRHQATYFKMCWKQNNHYNSNVWKRQNSDVLHSWSPWSNSVPAKVSTSCI